MTSAPPRLSGHTAKSWLAMLGIAVVSLASLQTCAPEENPGDGDGDGPSQSGCEQSRPEHSICLTSVTGRVIDEEGAPVKDTPVTVCGPVCHRGTTDAEGHFVIAVERFVSPGEYSVQPHGTPDGSTFYYPLPLDLSDGAYDAGTLRILAFDFTGDRLMTKLDLNGQTSPAQTVQSGPVRLSIAAGTVVRLTVGDALLPDDAGKFLRVTRLKEAEMEEFAPSVGALAMYAMGPFEAAFEGEAQSAPHVSVSFENEFSLNAGQKVTVLALGTYLDPDWLSPSKFESIGEATVSDDGQTIELTEAATGSGLRHLTWLALRP